jgi:hypothetical protein
MKKRWYYIVIGIVAVFIVTNPSIKAFKDHLGRTNYEYLSCKYNFFVCSIYLDDQQEYLGITGNFFPIQTQVTASIYPSVSSGSVRNDPNEIDIFSTKSPKPDTNFSKLSIDSELTLFIKKLKKKHSK